MTADVRGERILTTHCPCCKNMPYQHFLPMKSMECFTFHQQGHTWICCKPQTTNMEPVNRQLLCDLSALWDSFTAPVSVAQSSNLCDSSPMFWTTVNLKAWRQAETSRGTCLWFRKTFMMVFMMCSHTTTCYDGCCAQNSLQSIHNGRDIKIKRKK